MTRARIGINRKSGTRVGFGWPAAPLATVALEHRDHRRGTRARVGAANKLTTIHWCVVPGEMAEPHGRLFASGGRLSRARSFGVACYFAPVLRRHQVRKRRHRQAVVGSRRHPLGEFFTDGRCAHAARLKARRHCVDGEDDHEEDAGANPLHRATVQRATAAEKGARRDHFDLGVTERTPDILRARGERTSASTLRPRSWRIPTRASQLPNALRVLLAARAVNGETHARIQSSSSPSSRSPSAESGSERPY